MTEGKNYVLFDSFVAKATDRMKVVLSYLFTVFFCSAAVAQQDHFIYLQTENKQQFYVKLNDKVFTSSSLGYVIIPKLQDGTYTLTVGFSQTEPERQFQCIIDNKDVGFIIKNTDDKGWQLFNLLSLNTAVPVNIISKNNVARSDNAVYERDTDLFSTMLATAVHDSSILLKDVVVQTAADVIKDSTSSLIPANTVAITNSPAIKDQPGKKKLKKKPPANATDLKKTVALNKLPENKLPENSSIIQKDTLQKDTLQSVALSNVTLSSTDKKDTSQTTPPDVVASVNKKDTVGTAPVTDIAIVIPKDDKVSIDSSVTRAIKDSSVTQVVKDSSANDVAINDLPAKKKTKKKRIADDTLNAENNSNVQKTADPLQTTPEKDMAFLRSVIERRSRKTSKEGMEIVYVDESIDARDTIRVLIPSDKRKNKNEETGTTEPAISDIVITDKDTQKDAEPKNNAYYKITAAEREVIKEANKDMQGTMINSDCRNLATDDDFLKLRKKMVAEKNDDDMVKVAKKVFKTRCFSTEQIRNLSAVFLTDEGKYMFYDAAYPFASDSDLYYTLETQLSDNYYITRFKAMIHK